MLPKGKTKTRVWHMTYLKIRLRLTTKTRVWYMTTDNTMLPKGKTKTRAWHMTTDNTMLPKGKTKTRAWHMTYDNWQHICYLKVRLRLGLDIWLLTTLCYLKGKTKTRAWLTTLCMLP